MSEQCAAPSRRSGDESPTRVPSPPKSGEVRFSSVWSRPVAVLAVNPRRERALIQVEQPDGAVRVWENFKMIPPLVRKRAAPNPLLQFVAERCEIRPGLSVVSADLQAAYYAWCDERGVKALTWGGDADGSTACHALARLGLAPGFVWVGPRGAGVWQNRRKVRCWNGIGLR